MRAIYRHNRIIIVHVRYNLYESIQRVKLKIIFNFNYLTNMHLIEIIITLDTGFLILYKPFPLTKNTVSIRKIIIIAYLL